MGRSETKGNELQSINQSMFRLHRVSEHGAKDYHCAKCDLLLPTQELFSEHRNSHRRQGTGGNNYLVSLN